MTTLKELCGKLGLSLDDSRILGPNGKNIPAGKLVGGKAQTITDHDTANHNTGANAEMHYQFVKGGGGPEGVSFTLTVDDHQAIQILPLDHQQYAQGTSKGNTTSVSIEMCVNQDGNFDKTFQNLAILNAALCVLLDLPTSVVVQHNAWYGKDCPHDIRARGLWLKLLSDTQGYINQLVQPPPPPPNEVVLNGHKISGGFYGLWLRYGLEVLGYPEFDEYKVQEGAPINQLVTYQDFENAILQWYPGIEPRICAGIRKLKYGG